MPRSFRSLHVALAAFALFCVPALAQRGDPFAGLVGTWSGTGTVSLSGGTSERIRCRAAYSAPSANTLLQNLRCASDSFTFDLTSEVVNDNGTLSGRWSESTRNGGGSISGRASAGTIQALVEGPGFSANLSVTTRGDKQNVQIRSEGTELTGVTITLARGR